MEPLQWRALGRPPHPLRFGVRPALVVVAQMTPNKLHVHEVKLLQKQKSPKMLFSGTFENTKGCCRPRVLDVLALPRGKGTAATR